MSGSEADYYIGLMSGTSADGVDGVLVSFPPRSVDIEASVSIAFDQQFKEQLISLNQPQNNEIHLMNLCSNKLTDYYQQAVKKLLASTELATSRIRVIAMHGQTIRHRPDWGYSLQIGNAALLAERCAIDVAADFRSRDIAAGGQGAPIAPVLHQFLWHKDRPRVVVNLGGIANITLLTPGQQVTGFDTGPANALLDSWIQRHQNQPCDNEGKWAASGKCNQTLLKRLLQHPFFARKPPKSTGRDDFHLDWLDQQLRGIDLPAQDVQATLLALTAITIGDAIGKSGYSQSQIILCGGGSHNTALVHQLGVQLPESEIVTSAHFGLDPVEVEAVAFALLGKLCIERTEINLAGVTGARGGTTLGCIYQA